MQQSKYLVDVMVMVMVMMRVARMRVRNVDE